MRDGLAPGSEVQVRSVKVRRGRPRSALPRPVRNSLRAGASPIPRVAAKNSFAIWLCLIGLIVPAAEVYLTIAGGKFTIGRLGITLLLGPALVVLFRPDRKLIGADAIAIAIAGWMVMAATVVGGVGTVTSTIAVCLELVGGYCVARAFLFGPAALSEFIRVLRILVVIAVVIAIAEHLSARLILHDKIAELLHTTPPGAQYREGFVRATSTFDHAILFGAFCAFSATIFLFGEADPAKRLFSAGVAGFGALLSFSSSALMALFIVVTAYAYDCVMRQYSWRWGAFVALAAVPVLAISVGSGHPLNWVLSHLTLDPTSGFFRLMIWEGAIQRISESPLFGYGFNSLNSEILDATVDSVWLVMALRFGVPMLVLMLLWNLAAWKLAPRLSSAATHNSIVNRMATAFTMVLVIFIFIGITVHYWNFVWIFWGLCIGVRASIYEWSRGSVRGLAAPTRLALISGQAAR